MHRLLEFLDTVLRGVGQVMLQNNSYAGLLAAWGMGAAEPAMRSGAFGFNAVLTAIALGA